MSPILSPIIGGQMLHFMPWHGIFYLLACIGTLLLLYVLFGLKETLPQERRIKGGFKQTRNHFSMLFRDRFFLGLALSQGFAAACMFVYIQLSFCSAK